MAAMAPAMLERVCPYCASNKLTFLEHGDGGTLFQCERCRRAAVQRWEPEAESVTRTSAPERYLFPSPHQTDRTTPEGKPE